MLGFLSYFHLKLHVSPQMAFDIFVKKTLTENCHIREESMTHTHAEFLKDSQFCGKFLNGFSEVQVHV